MYEYIFLVSFIIQYYLLTLFHFLSLLLYYSSRRITHFHHILPISIIPYCPFPSRCIIADFPITHIIAHFPITSYYPFPSCRIIAIFPSCHIITHFHRAVLLHISPSRMILLLIFPSHRIIAHFSIMYYYYPFSHHALPISHYHHAALLPTFLSHHYNPYYY